ncbi:hypothetical protein X802_08005 [Thermococcus guaymasensis DSM 11113]|uniref:Uncharacterized protein n=1 Tax=Thermococcus guaymasensis DSM 11113 TaxID=1432656 RepID=A0A0X1KNG8_9EURY|nr:hypothetical protein X802_08005 [Thermococcus guaymasensis DSM 11113]
MGLTWTQLPEEIKYTAKQFGFYIIGIPSVVAVVYMFASWTPFRAMQSSERRASPLPS